MTVSRKSSLPAEKICVLTKRKGRHFSKKFKPGRAQDDC